MDKTVLSWRSHNNDQVVRAPIIHVAVAVADTDETYGAMAAVENNTSPNTNNSANLDLRRAPTSFPSGKKF